VKVAKESKEISGGCERQQTDGQFQFTAVHMSHGHLFFSIFNLTKH
jgi:hypothetical protein